MLTLLDTHAWVWWVTEDPRLSSRASAAIARGRRSGQLAVSLISAWEVAKKVGKGQLVLDRPLDQWLDQATAISGMLVADLTRPILVDSCRLPQPFHGDPADQIIVATARQQGAILVTKDRQLREYPHVRSIW
jgi:PIN domain nuclease of toxin-antitoxin system